MDGATFTRKQVLRFVHGAGVGPRGRPHLVHAALCHHAAHLAAHCMRGARPDSAADDAACNDATLRALTNDVVAAADAVRADGNAANTHALQSVLARVRALLFRARHRHTTLHTAYTAVGVAHMTCAALYAPSLLDVPSSLRHCVYVYRVTRDCADVASTSMDVATTAFVDGCDAEAATAFLLGVLAVMWQDPRAPQQLPESMDSYALTRRAQDALQRCRTRDGVPVVPFTVYRARAVLSMLHALGLRCPECAFMLNTVRAARCAVLAWRAAGCVRSEALSGDATAWVQ
uniref:Uncharacterized protein n=1 Tax=viral metagenome TaxID=1070528 RepID=A0A6C0AU64_9ZZZZ